MAAEVLEYLRPADGQTIVDCTLGGGGHARHLKLQTANLNIIGIDQDAEAIAAAQNALSDFSGVVYIQDNFANLAQHVNKPVDGFLFDLGVSSYQIDEPERGFSLREDGPLDMRMDRRQKLTAAEIVNSWPVEELTRIIQEYGEERFAKRISNAIRATRNAKMINTTFELKELVEKAIPTWKKRESVSRVFQALRIAVNAELANLQKELNDAVARLLPGGRIVVIAYHSLEDRPVKQTFRALGKDGILKVLTKKPLTASQEEIAMNPRSRSAKLRAAVRT